MNAYQMVLHRPVETAAENSKRKLVGGEVPAKRLSATPNQIALATATLGLTPTLRLMTSILALALDAGFAELSEAVEGGG
jgi:hypothetical protein